MLTALLMEQRAAIGPFRVFAGLGAEATILPKHTDLVTVVSYTGAGPNSALARAGMLEVLPSHYSDFPALIASRRLPVDVVLLQVAGPDQDGCYSLTAGDEWLSASIDGARVVIAEHNEQAPFTYSRLLHESEIDVLVTADHPPVELRRREPSEIDRCIAGHVAELVSDGATLQLGLGTLPEAIAEALGGHHDLGIHSGAIGDAALKLIEAGVVTNARKRTEPGRTVTGSLMGTRRLLDFADRNEELLVCATEVTHNPARLAAEPRLTAINSAFEVDLTGQVNAEVAGGRYAGAVGGAIDFLRGAARSPGGVPIVALPSQTRGVSRIVARLSGPVSTARADAGIIVTEVGVADLRGLTLAQRRERLLSIAHPDHRAVLEATASSGAANGF
jgi:acetyl-CoA hydrolase